MYKKELKRQNNPPPSTSGRISQVGGPTMTAPCASLPGTSTRSRLAWGGSRSGSPTPSRTCCASGNETERCHLSGYGVLGARLRDRPLRVRTVERGCYLFPGGAQRGGVRLASGIEADPDTRLITAGCGGISVSSVYVPNGRSLDSDHYQYKLLMAGAPGPAFVHRDRAQTTSRCAATSTSPLRIVTCGTWPPSREPLTSARPSGPRWLSSRRGVWSMLSPAVAQRRRLYTYWDYRAGNFHQHRGMRIDLLLMSAGLAAKATWAFVDRNARKGKDPSDHAPTLWTWPVSGVDGKRRGPVSSVDR